MGHKTDLWYLGRWLRNSRLYNGVSKMGGNSKRLSQVKFWSGFRGTDLVSLRPASLSVLFLRILTVPRPNPADESEENLPLPAILVQMVSFWLVRESEINNSFRNQELNLALYNAITKKGSANYEQIRMLLEHGAAPSYYDELGNCTLHYVAYAPEEFV